MEYEKRMDVFKDTTDDWSGSFKLSSPDQRHPGQLVQVSYMPLLKDKKYPDTYRVCAWGNDDFGLEKDFTDAAQALSLFLTIISQKVVTKKQLLDHGFVNS